MPSLNGSLVENRSEDEQDRLSQELQALGLSNGDIELELPDEIPGEMSMRILEDGSVEFAEDDDEGPDLSQIPHTANIAEYLEPKELLSLGSNVASYVDSDLESRRDWERHMSEELVLLGLRYEERTEPFPGATGVTHPLLNEAATQFQAQVYKELLPPSGPARIQIFGTPTPESEKRADRVHEYMNFRITQVMEEYDPETDQMFYTVGLYGSAFKKVYFDGVLGREVSRYIPAKDVIVPYTAVDLQSAGRVTHRFDITMHDLKKKQFTGMYMDVDLSGRQSEPDEIQQEEDDQSGQHPGDDDDVVTLLECHCYMDITGFEHIDPDTGEPSGMPLPYVITVDQDSGKVLSIYRNWQENDPKYAKIEYFAHYKFLPGNGFYGFGLIHMLGNLSRTATGVLRQLVDAGTLNNMPAGFKTRGMRIDKDDEPIVPGEWRDVDVASADLKNSLLPLPYKEPSATLFQLLGFCVEAARKFVGTADLGIADGSFKREMPVGTTMALLERGSRVVSAVHKRMYYAMRQELNLLYRVMSENPQESYPYPVEGGSQTFMQDFEPNFQIVPVADPNIFSSAQRMALAEMQLQLANQAPQLHNIHEAYRRMYAAIGATDIDSLLPPPKQPEPTDPATENANAVSVPSGGPALKAFPGQNHASHIAQHITFLTSQLVSTSPQVYAALLQHILEHIKLSATEEVFTKAGLPVEQEVQIRQALTKNNPGMLRQLESEISEVEEEQTAAVLGKIKEQTPKEDELVLLKSRELDIKEQSNKLREKEMHLDNAREYDRMGSQERQTQARIQSSEEMNEERIAAQEKMARMRSN